LVCAVESGGNVLEGAFVAETTKALLVLGYSHEESIVIVIYLLEVLA
jgi:hypothetical protein